jgi:hypothetical protein
MKPIIHFPSGIFTRSLRIYTILALLIFSLSSCFQHFYKTNTAFKTDSVSLEKLQAEKKVFFVHTPEGPFALKNVTVEKEMVSGDKESIDPKKEKYMNPIADASNRVNIRESKIIFNEVHLYTNVQFNDNGKVNLEISKIFRMDVYGPDTQATKSSRVVSIIGISAIPIAVIVVMAISISHGVLGGSGNFNIHD